MYSPQHRLAQLSSMPICFYNLATGFPRQIARSHIFHVQTIQPVLLTSTCSLKCVRLCIRYWGTHCWHAGTQTVKSLFWSDIMPPSDPTIGQSSVVRYGHPTDKIKALYGYTSVSFFLHAPSDSRQKEEASSLHFTPVLWQWVCEINLTLPVI